MSVNVATLISQIASRHPDDVVFTVASPELGDASNTTMTFGAFNGLVEGVACELAARGVGAGDRAVVFVPMSIELYVLIGALLHVGAVVVFIDPWIGTEGISRAVQMTRPKIFFGVPKAHLLRLKSRELRDISIAVRVLPDGYRESAAVRAIAAALPRSVHSRSFFGKTGDIGSAKREPVAVDAEDHALITFTSGSTGVPKGADRTHGFLAAQDQVLGMHMSQKPGDVHFTNLPIFSLHNIVRGVTTAMAPAAMSQDATPDGVKLLACVDNSRATVLTLSPGPLAEMKKAAFHHGVVLDRVRELYTGGGPVLPDLIDGLEKVLPNARVTVLYGSTECEPIGHLDGAKVLELRERIDRDGGIPLGIPVDETRVKLIRPVDGAIDGDQLEALDIGHGAATALQEPGEVLVAGDHVNRSYYRNEAAVKENKVVDPNGVLWHRTGDVVLADADGVLWLLGRVGSDVVAAGGKRIWPLQIQVPLEGLDGVDRVALIEHQGEVVLVVAERNSPKAKQIAAKWLSERGYEDSIRVVGMPTIPMDKRHAAKVDLAELRAAL